MVLLPHEEQLLSSRRASSTRSRSLIAWLFGLKVHFKVVGIQEPGKQGEIFLLRGGRKIRFNVTPREEREREDIPRKIHVSRQIIFYAIALLIVVLSKII